MYVSAYGAYPSPRIGQACYKCFKEEDAALSKCSSCKRVVYCSTACQSTDWPTHKGICKILKAARHPEFGAGYAGLWDVSKDENRGSSIALAYSRKLLSFVNRQSGVLPLRKADEYLITHEPKCLACGRPAHVRALTPCPECKTVFYCSPGHWNAVHAADISSDIRAHEIFRTTDAGKQLAVRPWVPSRIAKKWVPLASEGGVSQWEEAFGDELRKEFNLTDEAPVERYLWSMSEPMSMSMTILYALQELNDTDAWTRSETLVVGSYEMEVCQADVFEELHRLPQVKHLKIMFCGPELMAPNIVQLVQVTKTFGANQCCVGSSYDTRFYHDFVVRQGSRFKNPDLAIAFNSGASEESMATWPATFNCLVTRKIPAVFTAYNRTEADQEATLLRKGGATLWPSLTRRRNPWASLIAKPEPARVLGLDRWLEFLLVLRLVLLFAAE
ncbi:hypothetical protein B0H13DRAFT_2328417 [Mycena leptocephala]|nr:hypothetical protein B0H13DRAFT_2328417 [Mycena leptocephala]